MITLPQLIEFELLSSAAGLWESIALDRRQERWIIYANLRSPTRQSTEEAFRDSERILRAVLCSRMTARDWLATVLCGQRLSYTIRDE